jgi:hypothetical protein
MQRRAQYGPSGNNKGGARERRGKTLNVKCKSATQGGVRERRGKTLNVKCKSATQGGVRRPRRTILVL